MATLSNVDLEKYYRTPQNGISIQRAALDNERQMFHAMLTLRSEDVNGYKSTFLSKVQTILDNDVKFKKFESFMTYPLVSYALISKASDEFNKTFYAQDRTRELNFVDPALAAEMEEYLVDIDYESTLGQDIFTFVKQAVNTIAVVDVPTIEDPKLSVSGARTEPYVYFVDTGKVHDVGVNPNGTIQYLMFIRDAAEEGQRELVVIDGETYRVYSINDRSNGALSEIVNSTHGIGYCPATFIWRDAIDPANKVCRYNTVLEIVEDLDKYIMLSIFREHADLYASYPIMWRYLNACEVDENGNVNKEDYSGLMGPGQLVQIEMTEAENQRMSVPVGFVPMDTQILKYIEDKLRKLEVKITKHLTGVDNEIQNEKAFNESQIRSQYETRHSVLRYWAENFQAVDKFLVDTIARLIFGDVKLGGKFIGSTIDYGMDFFLYDTLTATKEYRDGVEAGLPPHMLDLILNKVIQANTRNNPNASERVRIINYLMPAMHTPLTLLNPASDDYALKSNFRYFIDKFELEFGSIIKFGSAVPLPKKIEVIKTQLKKYVTEHRKDNPYLGEGSVVNGEVGAGSKAIGV